MENIKFYEIDNTYIDYLSEYAPHLFRNKTSSQKFERKYIGVVLTINDVNYFVPLSSFKDKHNRMRENVDFLKVKSYAVLNLNNMFPAPLNLCKYIDISNVEDESYKNLLLAEYRYIKSIQEKILKNAITVYNHKKKNGDETPLAKRCNDFLLLEEKCKEYTAK